jgi:hypothetical protein
MKYLPLYYEWLEKRLPGGSGLCLALCEVSGKDYGHFTHVIFTEDEYDKEQAADFWFTEKRGVFTPNRQNIILLLAAENNEL